MRRFVRVGLLGAVVLACGLTAQASATVECAGSSTCTTVAGPWVVVPPSPNVGALNQITATWNLGCTGDFLIGSDWIAQDDPFLLSIWVSSTSGSRIYTDYQDFGFGAENDTSRPQTFQPLVGCSPDPPSGAGRATAAGVRGRVRRVTIRPLLPNRSRSFAFGCSPGERLVGSAHGIGFVQKRPPSRRELREIGAHRSHRRGKVRVKVVTGRHVGDDEQVQLQIHALCRPGRRGSSRTL
jgi:hypothetical protein